MISDGRLFKRLRTSVILLAMVPTTLRIAGVGPPRRPMVMGPEWAALGDQTIS